MATATIRAPDLNSQAQITIVRRGNERGLAMSALATAHCAFRNQRRRQPQQQPES